MAGKPSHGRGRCFDLTRPTPARKVAAWIDEHNRDRWHYSIDMRNPIDYELASQAGKQHGRGMTSGE
jgi:hypothetical protein